MVRFIRSLVVPGETARHDAASLIAAHGRAAIRKAHLACADGYVQADWKAFRQANGSSMKSGAASAGLLYQYVGPSENLRHSFKRVLAASA